MFNFDITNNKKINLFIIQKFIYIFLDYLESITVQFSSNLIRYHYFFNFFHSSRILKETVRRTPYILACIW